MHEPPSYEYAVAGSSQQPLMSQGPFSYTGESKAGTLTKAPADLDSKASPPGSPKLPPTTSYYPAPTGGAGPSTPSGVTVYHYQNPRTGHAITSLLPPDHPEMICMQEGQHITKSRFGLVGVLVAIFWFPLGIACCLLDRRVTCRRCGLVISHSFMDC
ncbi:hypothetical protein M407DRAFT_241489 [Tulasnella calospora MUT 4182]|uniref:Uncharacterized protein n=1 Tax=Tulasnella calospora MUT 4182 TaxID=1051891 RepID=A0A0C3LE29_9AGAM|nr:hypothetical protein M407DRAFT_241489 [Tulasnella calospora MUT 4182]